MNEKLLYQTPDILVTMMKQDIISTSFVDNDGDYRDWEEAGDAW